jgi:dTDP-4-amino-4,6-dideoxygalactose transaminase
VLLPAYLCATAVDAVTACGAEVAFYAVTRECATDLADLDRRIDASTRAVVIVHYFGFAQDTRACRDICDRAGVLLIEDCAHVLRGSIGGVPLGMTGDASVFSWRKLLALHDGGELILGRAAARARASLAVDWGWNLRAAKHAVDDLVEAHAAPAVQRAYRKLASVVRRGTPSTPTVDRDPGDENAEASSPAGMNRPMSWPSRFLLRHADLDRVVARRKANYRDLAKRLAGVPGVRLLTPPPGADVCPYVLPLVFERVAGPHLGLRQRGIPATTWAGVRPSEVRSGDFPIADDLYERLVHLPVHQSLRPADLDAIAAAVQAVAEAPDPTGATPTTQAAEARV